jgi:hypothetical protein
VVRVGLRLPRPLAVRIFKGSHAGCTARLVSVARHRLTAEIDGQIVPVSPGWVQLTEPDEIALFTTEDPGPGVRDLLTAWLLTPRHTFTRG